MRKTRQTSGECIVKDIKRKTRKQYSAEEKMSEVRNAPSPDITMILNVDLSRAA